MKRCFTVCAVLWIAVLSLSAQTVSFTGSALSENFDSMGSNGTTTVSGWFVGPAPGGTGPISKTTLAFGAGAPSTVTNWNVGATGSVDRALGSQAGTAAGGDLSMEVRISNDSGSAITSFVVSYDGEQWRANNATQNPQQLVMRFGTDGTNFIDMGPSFDFTSPITAGNTALNGNAAANRAAGLGGSYVPAQPIPPGTIFYLRWHDTNNSGNDHILAIDNFSFSLSGTTDIAISAPTNNQSFILGNNITVNINTNVGTAMTNVAFYSDGTLLGQDAARPFSAVYSNATLGAHTLLAVGQASSGSFTSAPVTITVRTNAPPSVTITNPVTGAQFLVGSLAAVGASASDDATVSRVEFYDNGTFRFSDTASPYLFNFNDMAAGNHVLTAVATDNGGLATTSAPVTITVTNEPNVIYLVTNGSNWKYLDNGSDQGAAWRILNFDDTGWTNGLAELGFGDSAESRPEVSVINGGPSTNRFITTYFRHAVVINNPGDYTNLIVRLLRDDGGIVYINNNEVFRSNMTNAAPMDTYTNHAANAADDGVGYFSTNVSPSVLVTGSNIIAVEIHQSSTNSSDLSFDLQLLGQRAPGPSLSISASGRTVTVSWTEPNFVLQYIDNLAAAPGGWQDVPNQSNPYQIQAAAPNPRARFYRLRSGP